MKKILASFLAFALSLTPVMADVIADPVFDGDGKGIVYIIVAAVAAVIGGLFLKRKK